MLLTGFAWISVVASLMTATQIALPSWVRARGLALFWVVLMGGMAAGSALWGQVASWFGISYALTLAGIGALFGIAITWRYRIGHHDAEDLSPTKPLPINLVDNEFEIDRGPVMVMVEYQIDPERIQNFNNAMQQVRTIRRRDGAFMWELFSNIEQQHCMVECFMVESWLEHLRQHERLTVADSLAINKALSFHLGSGPPKVTHLVSN